MAVWQDCGRRMQKMLLEEYDGIHLIKFLKDKLDRDDFLEALLVLRSLWLRRNEYVFQGIFTSPSQVIMKARALAAVCANSNQDEHIDSMAEGGRLKLNRDAALNSRSKKMGIGIVVQNKYGEFVAALAKVLPLVDNPTAAEAIAAWHVVSMCVNCRFQQIVLEGDSMVVVLALNQTMASWSSYGKLIEDTKEKVC
jgi:hypothetical protein